MKMYMMRSKVADWSTIIWSTGLKGKFVWNDCLRYPHFSCLHHKSNAHFPSKILSCRLNMKSRADWVPSMPTKERDEKWLARTLIFFSQSSEQLYEVFGHIVTGDKKLGHTSSPKRKFKQTISSCKVTCTAFWRAKVSCLWNSCLRAQQPTVTIIVRY